ncbi:FixH family protein [Ascidiaceihabitans sp.]|uniref:FixH family protein n=1 Tax=Ascidiaceihabitans sp. TaxID=1872644 RepID=UPI00329747E0
MSARKLTGWHVFTMFAVGFGIIITVNLTLAYNAVSSFPGVEVKNSYVASQSFDVRRDAQVSLGWQVTARAQNGEVRLIISDADGQPVKAQRLSATLGRATHVQSDMVPDFRFDGKGYTAQVDLAPGNWNIRMVAQAADGTAFEQRVILHVKG